MTVSPVIPPRGARETGRHRAPRRQAPPRSGPVLRGGWRPAALISVVGLSCLAAPTVTTVISGTSESGADTRLADDQLVYADVSMRVLGRASRSIDRRAPATGQPAGPASSGVGDAADEPEVPHPLFLLRPVEVAAPAAASAPAVAPVPVAAPTPAAATATPAPQAPIPAPAPKAPTTTPAPKAAAPTKAAAPAAPAAGGISAAPCAGGSAVESGLTPDAIRVHRAVCALFPSVTAYGGVGGGGEHATGRAVDIMIPSSGVGSQIAAWVRANARSLGVSEVIWSQHIWTVQRSGEGWRAMSDRGSATANHYDHVHVTVYGSSGG